MDALSLTRERVMVWVGAPLQDTGTHWRRRRILIRGDFSRPACTLSPTLSRTGEGWVWDLGARRYFSSAARQNFDAWRHKPASGAEDPHPALRADLSLPGEGSKR
jgi:hypothetical protein